MKYMNKDNINEFAFINTDTLVGSPRAVVVNFHGYTDTTVFNESPRQAKELGKEGILYVFPYFSPWAWLSKSSLAYIEEVIDVVYGMLGLDESVPLITAGGSMGGLTSIMYNVRGKRKPICTLANCPVVDMENGFNVKPIYTKRAIYSSMILEEGTTVEEEMHRRSPLYNIDRLPDIPFYIVFGGADERITGRGMEFKSKVLEAGKTNFYFEVVPGMKHCDLGSHEDAFCRYVAFILENVNNFYKK